MKNYEQLCTTVYETTDTNARNTANQALAAALADPQFLVKVKSIFGESGPSNGARRGKDWWRKSHVRGKAAFARACGRRMLHAAVGWAWGWGAVTPRVPVCQTDAVADVGGL